LKLYQFDYVTDSQNDKKPENIHLIIECVDPTDSDVTLLYLVDSADETKVYGSNDKGATWTQIDVDPSNSSGDNKSRDHNIRSFYHDRDNSKIYAIDGENDGSDTSFDIWYLDYSSGWGSESVTEVGSQSTMPNSQKCYAYDIYKRDGNVEALVTEYSGGQNNWVHIYDVDSHPFTHKDDAFYEHNLMKSGYVTVVGTDAYFPNSEGTGTRFFKFNGTAISSEYSFNTDYVYPANFDRFHFIYDDNDILYIVMKKNADSDEYLYGYSISGDTLTEYAEYNVYLMLDRNNDTRGDTPNPHEKGFESSGTKVYEIVPRQGRLFLLQDISLWDDFTASSTIIAITDTFLFVNNSGTIEVWEYTDILSSYLTYCKIERNMQGFSQAELEGNISFAANQLVKIYTDDTETRYSG
jgi:hypothetical protein